MQNEILNATSPESEGRRVSEREYVTGDTMETLVVIENL